LGTLLREELWPIMRLLENKVYGPKEGENGGMCIIRDITYIKMMAVF
jgi:hypothetical protein